MGWWLHEALEGQWHQRLAVPAVAVQGLPPLAGVIVVHSGNRVQHADYMSEDHTLGQTTRWNPICAGCNLQDISATECVRRESPLYTVRQNCQLPLAMAANKRLSLPLRGSSGWR